MINFAINKLDCLGVRCSYCSYLDKFRKVLIDIFIKIHLLLERAIPE